MSAETLRRAAAQMRERAEAATPGPWSASGDVSWAVLTDRPCYCDEPFCECDPVAAEVVDGHDAEHIASWHPAVALVVADWLTLVARGWSDDPGCDLGGGMDGPPCGECFKCAYYENQHRALAVAHTYLGEDA